MPSPSLTKIESLSVLVKKFGFSWEEMESFFVSEWSELIGIKSLKEGIMLRSGVDEIKVLVSEKFK